MIIPIVRENKNPYTSMKHQVSHVSNVRFLKT